MDVVGAGIAVVVVVIAGVVIAGVVIAAVIVVVVALVADGCVMASPISAIRGPEQFCRLNIRVSSSRNNNTEYHQNLFSISSVY